MSYRAIYADPPWPLTGGKNGKGGYSKTLAPDTHYSLMSLDAILAMDDVVKTLAADDSFLFLWTLNGMLMDGLAVMGAWGFRYVNNLVWFKTTGYGLGQYIRGQHEICLFGVRGKPGYHRVGGKRIQPTSVITAPRGPHSRKPDEMYAVIEKVTEGPYVELFARNAQPRNGWTFIGDEA